MKLKAAVVIANYGRKNAKHLERVLSEWAGMKEFEAEVTVLTETALNGAPSPSLPFLCRPVLTEKLEGETADLYVYSEDDILITERNLKAWCEVTAGSPRNDVAGFLRYELAADGGLSFPDMHGAFHWENVEESHGRKFAAFTNCCAACYVLTGWQLRIAMESGGFLVPMHSDSIYGALERGSADIYLQCGLRRLIPLDRFDEFLVHHLPDNYLHLGKPEAAVRAELQAMGVEWKP